MMKITEKQADSIVSISYSYLGCKFCLETFNCVQFVRKVYNEVNIVLPLLAKNMIPPKDFNLNIKEFENMPMGHSVFFKNKSSQLSRYWTHIGIIINKKQIIHCTRNLGNGVVISTKDEILDAYYFIPNT